MEIDSVTLERALEILGQLLEDRGYYHEVVAIAKSWCTTHDISEPFADELNRAVAALERANG